MQKICVFKYCVLCFILVIYKADSTSDSLSGSDEANIVKLDDTADSKKTDGDIAVDDENSDEAVADETINSDENNPVQDDDQDNNEPTNAGNENNIQNGVQNTKEETGGVVTQDDVPDANEPTEREEKEDEAQSDASFETFEQEMKIQGFKNMDTFYDGSVTRDKSYSIPAFKLSAAEKEKFKIWPEAKVPYYIDDLSYDKVLRDKIRGYLDYAKSRTNIDFHELFEPPTDENERWIFFVNRRGQLDCKDYSTKSFTNKGVQKVTVGYDCLKHGGHMAAIVLALLGVPPQHNSPDRDKFVTINEKNILPEKLVFFKKLDNGDWLYHDFPYDHISAGNYPPHKYTANGNTTIEIKADTYEPFQLVYDIVYGEGPKNYSPLDLAKIISLYNDIIFKKDNKRLKLEDCKALFKPGPGFGHTKLKKLNEIPERKKPKEYLLAAKKLYAYKDLYGEALSSLEDKK